MHKRKAQSITEEVVLLGARLHFDAAASTQQHHLNAARAWFGYPSTH